MTNIKFLGSALLLLAPLAMQASAQDRRGDADAAYEGRLSGSLMPLRSIESGIVPQMKSRGADYIGAEYHEDGRHYRLKFMRKGSVIWVDVDGRSGAIVGRAGE